MLRIRTNKENTREFALPIPTCKTQTSAYLPLLLIVDDDSQILRVSKRLLKSMFRIETASNAYEAAYLLKRKYYEAILTDFEMPGKSGLWLLEIARKYHPLIRRVLFSGSSPGNLPELIQSGLVHSFVAKPAGREELVASLTDDCEHSPN